VKCLYCGKGIGPIRLLRNREFCTDEHRDEFRERYRQQLYEALAPEPAPTSLAEFRGQTPATRGPAPTAHLGVLPKSLPGELLPPVCTSVATAAGMPAEEAALVLEKRLEATPTRLVWQNSAAAFPWNIAPVSFSMDIQPSHGSAAGAAPTNLVAGNPAARPPAAAPRISASKPSRPRSAGLPAAARISAPPAAELSSTRLQAAVPAFSDPAAIGPVPSARHSAVALPRSTAAPRTPALPGLESVPAASLSPAVIAAQPRPLEAGPLPARCDLKAAIDTGALVAFERDSRALGIILPKPPALSEQTQPTELVQPEPRRSLAVSGATVGPVLNLPAFVASPRAQSLPDLALALGPKARTDAGSRPPVPSANLASSPAESSAAPGTLAGWLQPGSPVQEAAGSRIPRSAPERIPAQETCQEPAALPGALLGELGSAPLNRKVVPAPAAPSAAVPSWDASRTENRDRLAAPLADNTLSRLDCLPALADMMGEFAVQPPTDVRRAVRASAVLWTLRVVPVCNPPFLMEPVKARFSDLVRADRGMAYSHDTEGRRPAKTNLLPFKRQTSLSHKQKWQYIGAAAAALLLAGVLRPQVAPRIFAEGLPWHDVPIRQWMSQRATHTFADNFRAGLDQWKGVQPKWPKSWSYSTDGFIHPGQLALYRPSVPLADYKFEFMAQIESKSVDWVVRAKDADNYYALKFTVVQPGPRPMVAMVRYPVVGGMQGPHVQRPLRMMIHANTPYRVTVDVKGNNYRAFVEDQEADFWTDDRLKTGGVGFFSEAGEHARVYWVKLESHGDILGRICGLLSGHSSDGQTNKETQAMNYRHAGTTEINKAPILGGGDAAATTAQETRVSKVLSKAASLHLDGKLEEGAKELARALESGERHPAVFFALGQLQYELQQYGPAAQSYTQAALLQPLHPTAHFNAGVCLGRSERWEEAASAFRKAVSNDPARTEAHLALGACLVQMGLHNEALDAYDRFLEHHPDHEEALFGKAVALQKRDRSSEAVELYRRILNRNPHSEEALSNLVSLSLANQDYEQVRKFAQKLADSQPKSQIAMEGLAGAAFAAGDHRAAADYSRKLAELSPLVFENWFNLGVACHKAGDLANAAEAYARAAVVHPDSPQAHLNLGVALQEQGDPKGARAAYQKALQIDPKLAGVHWNLGLVHEQLGDAEAAEKLYAQVPENSPDADDAAFRVGHLRLERADYPGSIAAFRTCLTKRPNWPEARLNLGIAYWRAGDKEAARTCFQELTGSGTEAKEALRGLAALSLENNDYDKAFEIYRQLLDSGERSPELLYNAGLICQKRGEPEDAAVLYREALKTDPQFGEALLNLGHALMSLGNEFEARSCWRKAVIAKPELAQRYFEPAVAQAS
jgi:tetratricopeptide (TPR) repeat protein